MHAFRLMEIAEDELHAAGCARVPGLFVALCPTAGIDKLDEAVYRAHVRELIGRSQRGESLDPGTEVEVMYALHLASLKAPLGVIPTTLYERLFHKTLPGRLTGDDLGRDPWPGACDELLATMRRKLTCKGRGV